MAVPVVVVSGFLGCGKTSFLRNLLPLCPEAGVRPALIVNEVGDVDVDGELLADLHAEQVRLIGGCVCCTLQSRLSETVYDILEQRTYDLIIIECSGLSNPLDVVSALSAPALIREIAVSHIICLVDAGRAERVLQTAELARTQVESSDIVVLNKADTIDGARGAVEALASELSSKAAVFWASYGDIGRENLLSILTDPAPLRCSCGCGHDHGHSHAHEHSHSLPASFCTVAFQLPEKIERKSLEALIASLPDNVVRAKGFADVESEGWQILHKVYDSTSIMPLSGGAPGSGAVLVCIGQHLSADDLRELVQTTGI